MEPVHSHWAYRWSRLTRRQAIAARYARHVKSNRSTLWPSPSSCPQSHKYTVAPSSVAHGHVHADPRGIAWWRHPYAPPTPHELPADTYVTSWHKVDPWQPTDSHHIRCQFGSMKPTIGPVSIHQGRTKPSGIVVPEISFRAARHAHFGGVGAVSEIPSRRRRIWPTASLATSIDTGVDTCICSISRRTAP